MLQEGQISSKMSVVEYSTVALEQDGSNPLASWGFSVWNFHVLPVCIDPFWVLLLPATMGLH